RSRRSDRTVGKQAHSLIDIFNVLSRRNTQPLPQTTDNRRLIALVLNEPVRSNQRLECFLDRVRRAFNKTPTCHHAGSLIWNIKFGQLRQDTAAAARYDPAESVT